MTRSRRTACPGSGCRIATASSASTPRCLRRHQFRGTLDTRWRSALTAFAGGVTSLFWPGVAAAAPASSPLKHVVDTAEHSGALTAVADIDIANDKRPRDCAEGQAADLMQL